MLICYEIFFHISSFYMDKVLPMSILIHECLILIERIYLLESIFRILLDSSLAFQPVIILQIDHFWLNIRSKLLNWTITWILKYENLFVLVLRYNIFFWNSSLSWENITLKNGVGMKILGFVLNVQCRSI